MPKISRFQKFILVFFNIILVILLIWSFTYTLMTSKKFYDYEFEKQDVIMRTGLNERQLENIARHIIDYLTDEKDSFQMRINNQNLFSKQAIYHMEDVKNLFLGIQNVLWYVFLIWIFLGIYLYYKRKEYRKYFFKVSFIVFIALILLFIIIGIIALIDFDVVFNGFHRLIFWDEISYRDSFFTDNSFYVEEPGVDNRMLVKILPMGLFADAAAIIIIGSIVVLSIINIILFIRHRKHQKEFSLEENQV